MRSDSHHDLYRPKQEVRNLGKGLLFLVLFFGIAMGMVQLIVYLFS